MEPLTLAATAIAATVMTKFWEKTGEKLSDELFEKGEGFYESLRRSAPETALAIQRSPEAPLDYGRAVLEVSAIAEQDRNLASEMEVLAIAAQKESNDTFQKMIQESLQTIQNQQPTIQNTGKVADKIGLFVQGGTVNIQNFSAD